MVLFTIVNPPDQHSDPHTVMLIDPIVVQLGGRSFIRGKQYIPDYLESNYDFYKGVDTGISLDNIDMFYAFDPDQSEKFIEYWKARSE
jgi:hypothetical protein